MVFHDDWKQWRDSATCLDLSQTLITPRRPEYLAVNGFYLLKLFISWQVAVAATVFMEVPIQTLALALTGFLICQGDRFL